MKVIRQEVFGLFRKLISCSLLLLVALGLFNLTLSPVKADPEKPKLSSELLGDPAAPVGIRLTWNASSEYRYCVYHSEIPNRFGTLISAELEGNAFNEREHFLHF